MKKCLVGAAIAFGLMLPAMAQASQTWWVCVAEVPVSKTVGVKMSWVGPAGRWNEVHNTYLAGFDTPAPYEQALGLSDAYAAEYQTFLLTSGYDLTPRISGRTTDVVCLYYRSEAERTQVAAELATGRPEQQGVKLDLMPTFVPWQPASLQTATKPAEPATQAPAPVTAPALSAPVAAPVAAEVQKAVDLALTAEKKARARAKDAEDVATQAKTAAAQAEAEALKAEQGQAGYVVSKYKNFGPEMLRYAGQALNGATPVLGVTTYAKQPDARAAGETILFTVKTVGTAPVMSGLGVVFASPADNYAGRLDRGALSGLGTYDKAGMHSAGDFLSMSLNGLGIATRSGGEFAGEFKNDQLDGYGVMVTTEGKRRVGHFTANMLDGAGAEYAPDGTVKQGIWSGGTLVTPVP